MTELVTRIRQGRNKPERESIREDARLVTTTFTITTRTAVRQRKIPERQEGLAASGMGNLFHRDYMELNENAMTLDSHGPGLDHMV
jgi:hypothetical protein